MRQNLGMFLQVIGLSLTLGAFLSFGFRPTMEQMMLYAGTGIGAFYLGTAVRGRN